MQPFAVCKRSICDTTVSDSALDSAGTLLSQAFWPSVKPGPGGGSRTCEGNVPVEHRAGTLSTVPPTFYMHSSDVLTDGGPESPRSPCCGLAVYKNPNPLVNEYNLLTQCFAETAVSTVGCSKPSWLVLRYQQLSAILAAAAVAASATAITTQCLGKQQQ
ncbi:hypothetical protein PoB_003206500 [Plakobranchus ocellatus]|uniref:Uncharacterized protein n=1 Tax=Plakobranchus ocellatus TaxID=259542 RepID=A0AAV4ABM5_9GAST|nr:hypothetical protein PoB_003206500 [Plakobranchus ocellatus]